MPRGSARHKLHQHVSVSEQWQLQPCGRGLSLHPWLGGELESDECLKSEAGHVHHQAVSGVMAAGDGDGGNL